MEETHPLSSSSSKQLTIYLWFRETDHDRQDSRTTRKKSTLYKLDLDQLHLPETELTLVSKTDLIEGFSAVASDSTIYVLGGRTSDFSAREVYYLETLCPDLGWKIGPALNFPRTNTADVYVEGGKICVSGGVESKHKGEKVNNDRIEFLDPLLNSWSLVEENSYWSEPECEDEDYVSCTELESNVSVYGWSSMLRSGEEVMCLDWRGVYLPWKKHNKPFLVVVGNGRWCLLWESVNGIRCAKFRNSVHSDDGGEVAIIATVEAFRVFSGYEPMMDKERRYNKHLKDCLVL